MNRAKFKTKRYIAWINMKQRCLNKKNPSYKRWGGRGIIVCEKWRDSYEQFCVDMGKCPSKKHSLERIDNNGNYEPGNVRWATSKEQMRNTSRNIFIQYKGERLTATDWSLRLSKNPFLVYNRLNQGWPRKDAVSKKIRRVNRHNYLTHNGKTMKIREWSVYFGGSPNLISNRLKSGWSIEESLSLKIQSE